MPNKLYILVVSSIFFTISDIFFSISCIFPKTSCMYLLDVLDILQQVFLSETARHTPGQGNVPTKVHRRVNEVQCSDDVESLTDELWQYAIDDFSSASISLIIKQSARDYYQSTLPLPCLSFHLQSVHAPFISWERSNPRVSKEVLKCKVLTSPASQCFSIQSTKVGENETKRLLIDFSHVVGLEVNKDSMVMDVALLRKMERKVHAKPGGKAEGGKWREQSLHVPDDKTPRRIKLFVVGGREPGLTKLQETSNKVPLFKRAIEGGLSDVYAIYDDPNENPEERYPIVQDPSLVGAAQLACLRLVNTIPSTNKAEYAIKMYASMERKFNQLFRERSHEAPTVTH